MKLICIGRNYVKHIEELGNEKPESPIILVSNRFQETSTPDIQHT